MSLEKAAIFSNATIDRNKQPGKEVYKGPGGPLKYMKAALEGLGFKITAFVPWGNDFPVNVLTGIELYPSKPTGETSLRFDNDDNFSPRRQYVHTGDCPIVPPIDLLTETEIAELDLVIIAPLLPWGADNYLNIIRMFRGNERKQRFGKPFIMMVPQGDARVVAYDGLISHRDWPGNDQKIWEVIANTDLIVFSEDDIPGIDDKAQIWSTYPAIGQSPVVVVTRNKKGSTTYIDGAVIHDHAYYIADSEIINRTGLGDVFAAALSGHLLWSGLMQRLEQSIRYAHAAAGLTLLTTPDQLQLSYERVESFMRSRSLRE